MSARFVKIALGIAFSAALVAPAAGDPLGKGLAGDVSPERHGQTEGRGPSMENMGDHKAERHATRRQIDNTRQEAALTRMQGQAARLAPAMSAYQACMQEKKLSCAADLKSAIGAEAAMGQQQ